MLTPRYFWYELKGNILQEPASATDRSCEVCDINYMGPFHGYATQEAALAAYEEYQVKCAWWDSFDSLALITHYTYTNT